MKSGTRPLLLMLAFLLGAKALGLLPQSRELEEWKLVTSLALDTGEEAVTATEIGRAHV